MKYGQKPSFQIEWPMTSVQFSNCIFFKPIFSKRNKNIQIEKWPKHVNCETGLLLSLVCGSHGSFHSTNFSLIGSRWAQLLGKEILNPGDNWECLKAFLLFFLKVKTSYQLNG